MAVNKAILIGFLGHDPSMKNFEGGMRNASFSLATSESYTNKQGEKVTHTQWHNVVAWRGLADVIEKYATKGSKLYVEGKITYRDYENKEGQKRQVTEIVAESIQLLDSRRENTAPAPAPTPAQPFNVEGKAHSYPAPAAPSSERPDKFGSQSAEDAFGMPENTDDLPF